MSRPCFALLIVFAAALFHPSHACLAASGSGMQAAGEERGAASIHAADLMLTDRWLASPAMAGRLAASPEYLRAAHEMATRFAAAGLEPAGEDGFFQHLDVEYNEIRSCSLGWSREGRAWRTFAHGPDYTCRGLSGSATLEAPVVFAGYGLSEPAHGYDDYAGLDARGKIVLVIKEAPPFRVDSTAWGERTLTRPRARAARAHGAVGLLIVPSPNTAHPQQPIASMLEGPGPQDEAFPAMQVSVAAAESLVAGTGARLGALQAAIDSSHAPHPLPLPARVRMAVAARYTAAKGSLSVVGRVSGSDPALARECVVVGAHLDHVGRQAGLVFPGANDNASGASAVLQLARAFAAAGERPKRTVYFCLFSSEESGLFGSLHFVAHPPVPLANVVAYLNMDCVGVGDSLEVHGGETWQTLWAVVRAADAAGDSRVLLPHSGTGGGADAQPFSDRGIPTAYFASHPSYTHLHLPTDTPETLNPSLFEAISRTAFRTAWRIGQGEATK